MNGEQLGKFLSADDDHKLKYAKVLGGYFFDSPCIAYIVCWVFTWFQTVFKV